MTESQASPISDGKPKTPCCGVKFLALWDYRKAHHERFRFICSRCGDPVDLPVGSKMEQTDPQRLSDNKPEQTHYVKVGKTYVSDCCKAYPRATIETSTLGGICETFYKCAECGKRCKLAELSLPPPKIAVDAATGKDIIVKSVWDGKKWRPLTPDQAAIFKKGKWEPITPEEAEKKREPSARDFKRSSLPTAEELTRHHERRMADEQKRKWMEEGARKALARVLDHEVDTDIYGFMIPPDAVDRMLQNRDYGFLVDDRPAFLKKCENQHHHLD